MENPIKSNFLKGELFSIDRKEKSPMIIKRSHICALALTAALAAGGAYAGHSYQMTKEALAATQAQLQAVTEQKSSLEEKAKALEAQNHEISANLSQLSEKAEDLYTKLNTLEKEKATIFNELNKLQNGEDILTPSDTTSANEASATDTVTLRDAPSAEIASDNIIVLPQSVNAFSIKELVLPNVPALKSAMLSKKLEDITTALDTQAVAYSGLEENVIKTAANMTSMPTLWPVRGQVSSEFGYRSDPLNESEAFHQGLDIRVPIGAPVAASGSGLVKTAEFNPSYGYMVEISHGNGYSTLYAHNSSLNVQVGDQVSRGDIIAYSGNTGRVTGPHVHFEVKYQGELQDPRDFLK